MIRYSRRIRGGGRRSIRGNVESATEEDIIDVESTTERDITDVGY